MTEVQIKGVFLELRPVRRRTESAPSFQLFASEHQHRMNIFSELVSFSSEETMKVIEQHNT